MSDGQYSGANPINVLHVPFTYFPDPAGGTEYYVEALIRALREHGIEGMVAAPGDPDGEYVHDGARVYRLKGAKSRKPAHAYGAPDEVFGLGFRRLLQHRRPEIVHLHAHTSAVSYRLGAYAREVGAKLCFTYHTPSVSCLRGTMMQFGRKPCDGKLDVCRCSVCVFQSRGMPAPLGNIFAAVSPAVGGAFMNAGLSGRAATVLGMPRLMQDAHRRFRKLIEGADAVVAVCQWVADVLAVNGVSPTKVVVCRQGLYTRAAVSRAPGNYPRSEGPLRLGYFGRIDPVKGLDTVIEAIRRIPQAAVRLDIYGICQPGSESYLSRLKRMADSRIRFNAPLDQTEIIDAMRQCDFVVIPSHWLETGPLVAYEAFAAGTPVLGSRLGGIAELVHHDRDGVLVAPDDPAAWSDTLASLANDPERIDRLREGVRPPRTMTDVAGEMATLYRRVLTPGAAAPATQATQVA